MGGVAGQGEGRQQGALARLAIFELYGTKCRDLLSSDATIGGVEAEPPFLLEDSGTGGGGAGASPPPPPPPPPLPGAAATLLKAAARSASKQRQGLVGDSEEEDVASRGSSPEH
jgi:hypothetical protein